MSSWPHAHSSYRNFLPVLCTLLTKIIDSSLSSGFVPFSLKIAAITLALKTIWKWLRGLQQFPTNLQSPIPCKKNVLSELLPASSRLICQLTTYGRHFNEVSGKTQYRDCPYQGYKYLLLAADSVYITMLIFLILLWLMIPMIPLSNSYI